MIVQTTWPANTEVSVTFGHSYEDAGPFVKWLTARRRGQLQRVKLVWTAGIDLTRQLILAFLKHHDTLEEIDVCVVSGLEKALVNNGQVLEALFSICTKLRSVRFSYLVRGHGEYWEKLRGKHFPERMGHRSSKFRAPYNGKETELSIQKSSHLAQCRRLC